MFGSGGTQDFIISILYTLPAILIGFSFHEFAHAFVADKLGDPTPRNQGRLTLSPHSHIDPIGFLLILIAGLGWAKPVQINRSYFKNPNRDDALVSFAGPAMNLLIAIFSVTCMKILTLIPLSFISSDILFIIYTLAFYMLRINVLLFIFNLLPIPPLDGFHILESFLPAKYYRQLDFLNRYGLIILLVLVFALGSYTILPLIKFTTNLLLSIFGLLNI